ncbi:hypothetical protein TNCV_541941 [Trichonephila clavipes]|nr:hypothetical protein TNCV_541941 [Trichonephila clavipes]
MAPWARRLGCVLALDKCVQMWTRNYGALGQTARVCFGVLCANKKEEVKRDFGDLRIRRSEGRVVNTPLGFKRVLLEEKGKRRGDPKGEVEEKKERTRKRRKKSSEKRRAGRLRKRRGESQSFLIRDAVQESKTRMRNNALRTGRRQAVVVPAKEAAGQPLQQLDFLDKRERLAIGYVAAGREIGKISGLTGDRRPSMLGGKATGQLN